MPEQKAITPRNEIESRIIKLQSELESNQIDGALILQRADLFYYTGTIQMGSLYVPHAGEPILMVYRSLERAEAESPIKRIVRLTSPKKIPGTLKDHDITTPSVLGLELDVLPANLYFMYQGIFENARIIDISPRIRRLRSVKSPFEIDCIRQAARFSDEVASEVSGILQEGMTELEFAGAIELEARKRGHQGILRMRLWGNEMFYGHIMSGPSAAVPSYLASPTGGEGVSPAVAQGPGFRRIKRHEPVLLDYVFVHNGYISDHTRIFALGAVPDELVAAHRSMLELQTLLKREAKAGVSSGRIYDLAMEYVKERGCEDNFMGAGNDRVRFVGHGVGLEIDEYPFLAQGQKLELQPGMTLALEPKLVFPGKGVVGIENTHVVTGDGLEQLTTFPEDIVVI